MFGLGIQELFLILLIILIFFGAEKIPQLAKSLGKGIVEFKKAQQNTVDDVSDKPANQAPCPCECSDEKSVIKKTPVGLSSRTCPACLGKVHNDAKFCSKCGRPMNIKILCQYCQEQVQPEDQFCPSCGQEQKKSQE